MLMGLGSPDSYLTEEQTANIVQEALGTLALDGKRVLILIPDSTRSMPMPLMFNLFEKYLGRAGSKTGLPGGIGYSPTHD